MKNWKYRNWSESSEFYETEQILSDSERNDSSLSLSVNKEELSGFDDSDRKLSDSLSKDSSSSLLSWTDAKESGFSSNLIT